LILACVQLVLLVLCCGCLKAAECLRVRSYTIDLIWVIAKEIPQISIIFHINLCRDGWFKWSSLIRALFSIGITIWKLYNLYNFLREDVKSTDIPKWCRAKRLYICFPVFLIPVWIVNLALSIMIAVLFIRRHHGPGYIEIPGSIHRLHVHDKYLYTKYIERSGIYLQWPEENFDDSYIKLAEIAYIMANKRMKVRLSFNLPYVCFERSLYDREASQCWKFDSPTKTFRMISNNEYQQNGREQNATFTFEYRSPSNQYNLGQIVYKGRITPGQLSFNKLLYFRLHENNVQINDKDFLYENNLNQTYEFYEINRQLIPIERAWRYGLGKCRPCILGPQLSKT